MSDLVLYAVFGGVVIVLLAIDLLVVHRNPHEVDVREAATWTAIWIGVAILFGAFLPVFYDGDLAGVRSAYFTGYVIEKSLSVDNVFLFLLIFSVLAVPKHLQHRALFYGVVGAIVMRTVLIFAGVALVDRFDWLLYVFGAFLIYAGIRTFLQRETHPDITTSPVFQRITRVLPTTDEYHGTKFFVRIDGRLLATPLFVVLLLVEFADLVFAVDSIPAIFAVTRDPFLVLTSNVFAILGLRALYFLLAGFAARMRYLKTGLSIVLVYVGVKLFTENISGIYHPTPLQSLAVIGAVLTVTVVASLRAAPLADDVPPSGIGPFGRPAEPAKEDDAAAE
ncbi:MAG: TerC family protein [Nitriliruptoraceae bacterium]